MTEGELGALSKLAWCGNFARWGLFCWLAGYLSGLFFSKISVLFAAKTVLGPARRGRVINAASHGRNSPKINEHEGSHFDCQIPPAGTLLEAGTTRNQTYVEVDKCSTCVSLPINAHSGRSLCG